MMYDGLDVGRLERDYRLIHHRDDGQGGGWKLAGWPTMGAPQTRQRLGAPRPKKVLRASGPVPRALMRPHRRQDQVTRSASRSYSECQSCRPTRHFRGRMAPPFDNRSVSHWGGRRGKRAESPATPGALSLVSGPCSHFGRLECHHRLVHERDDGQGSGRDSVAQGIRSGISRPAACCEHPPGRHEIS